jgi:hypothetical protein
MKFPKEVLLACKRNGIVPGRHLLIVRIASQSASLFQRRSAGRWTGPARNGYSSGAFGVGPEYRLVKTFRCSTSRFGIGQIENSNCTPLGLHRVAEKIGGGWPVGAVFKSRKFVGFTWHGHPLATITHRILWLEGLEPGFNRGGSVDSHARYIYIHGTGNEPSLGRPASHGCIHLSADDLIPLFDCTPGGMLVWVSER